MLLAQAVEEFLIAGEADGLSRATTRWYSSLMKGLITSMGKRDLSGITASDMRRYIVALDVQGYSDDTISAHKRALHRFWKWCTVEYNIPNPMANIRYPKQIRQHDPKAVTLEDVLQLFEAARAENETRHPLSKFRDPAMIAFLFDTGCRGEGIVSLKMSNLDMDRRMAVVQEKGRKTRRVVFTRLTAELLKRWLDVRSDVETVFYNLHTGQKMQVNGLYQMLKRLAESAGIAGRWNPHAFRHAFAREYLRAGGDLVTLSRLMGHSDVSTTANFYAIYTQDELDERHEQYSPMRRVKNQNVLENEDI